MRLQTLFDVREAAAKLGVGPAQGLFRVHLQEPRNIHDHEQQVADFVLKGFLAIRPCAPVQFGQLLAQFFENLVDVVPVESGPGRAPGDLASFHQGREAARDTCEKPFGLRALPPFPSALISSHLRTTSSAVFASPSPNTCG